MAGPNGNTVKRPDDYEDVGAIDDLLALTKLENLTNEYIKAQDEVIFGCCKALQMYEIFINKMEQLLRQLSASTGVRSETHIHNPSRTYRAERQMISCSTIAQSFV
jgi:hypothetical protein